jgi:hypothetical protein
MILTAQIVKVCSTIRSYGAGIGIESGDIKINISPNVPPTHPGRPGVVGGRIVCHSGEAARTAGAKYRITLYKSAFFGKCRAQIFNTIAHEFKHILQVIENNLSCTGVENIAAYEKESYTWADYIAPLCSNC